MSAPSGPSVCIIVTAYNYGHFLEDCLESVRAQTVPPNEVVIVNDGSVDSTEDILSRQDAFTIISQSNKGQAAAFNAGFAATTADIVIFLDADDRLRPDAISLIRTLWSDGISVLSFGLDMVDRDGQSVGRYAMTMPDVDLKARLLQDIAMPFMPTSGNAFSRRAIRYAFPLPEPRWKISADAVLIRAAVFAAPQRHTPHILGEYRVHRHNNWFQAVAAEDWRLQRGHLDIAQVGLELVDLCARKNAPQLTRVERLSLLFAALKAGVKASELGEGSGRLRGFLSAALARWSPRSGLRPFFGLVTLWTILPLSTRARRWLIDRPQRPVLIERLARVFTQPVVDDELAPRKPYTRQLSYGAPKNRPLDPVFPGTAWARHWTSTVFDLCADEGEIVFTRPTAAGAELQVTLEPGEVPVHVELRQDDTTLMRFELTAIDCISVPLRTTDPVSASEDRIVFRVTRICAPWWNPARWTTTCCRLTVHGVALATPVLPPAGALLPIGRAVPVDEVAAAMTNESASLEELFLAAPEIEPPYSLVLSLGADQAPGWLTVAIAETTVFRGDVFAGQRIVAVLSETAAEFGDVLPVQLDFRADDVMEDNELNLVAIGWLHDSLSAESGARSLTAGQRLGPEFLPEDRKLFLQGWDLSSEKQPLTLDANAMLQFSAGPGKASEPLQLRVDLGPYGDVPPKDAPALVISLNGRKKAASRLGGRHVFTVNFTRAELGPDATGVLGIHAGEAEEDGTLRAHGGIVFYGLGLVGESTEPARPLVGRQLATRHLRLTELANLSEVPIDERPALLQEIQGLATRALGDFLDPSTLERLSDLGRRASPLGRLELPEPEAPDWLRWFARAMLHGSPFLTAPQLDLADVPRLDLNYCKVIGRWFGTRPDQALSCDATQDFEIWLARKLQEIRSILATAEPSDSQYGLARHMLSAVDIAGLTSDELRRAFVAAIETAEARAGGAIGQPPIHAGGGIGLLVARADDLAPGGPAARMAEALSANQPATILVAEGCIADDPRVVILGGHSTEAAIGHVLGLGLDVLIIAAPLTRYDSVTRLAAQRLAHRQIVLGPAPAFSSLDAVLRGAWLQHGDGDLPGLGRFLASAEAPQPDALAQVRLRMNLDGLHLHVINGGTGMDASLDGLKSELPALTLTAEAPLVRTESRSITAAAGRVSADLVLSLGNTVEAALGQFLEIGAPGAVCVAGDEEVLPLRRGLTALGLEDCFAETAAAAHARLLALAKDKTARRTARSAVDTALQRVTEAEKDLATWCARQGPTPAVAPKYLFHHLVKTGGTSLRNLFHNWFPVTEDYRTPWTTEVGAPVDIASFPPGHMLVGHFASDGLPLSDRYPSLKRDPGWRRISFVRDPFDLALSWYNFEKQIRPPHDPDFIAKPIDTFFETYTGRYLEHFECDESNWQEVVDSYWFIGTLERVESCLDHLAMVLEKPRVDLDFRNRTLEKETPSEAAITAFAERMALEFEIYRYIDAKLSDCLARPWTANGAES